MHSFSLMVLSEFVILEENVCGRILDVLLLCVLLTISPKSSLHSFGSGSPSYHTHITKHFKVQMYVTSPVHRSRALTSPICQAFTFSLVWLLSFFLVTQCYGEDIHLLQGYCPHEQLLNLVFTSPTYYFLL